MSTKALVARKINASAFKAWDAISKLGRLDVWFLSIAPCRLEGQGVGARRFLTFKGEAGLLGLKSDLGG
jgi:hypothetical protein